MHGFESIFELLSYFFSFLDHVGVGFVDSFSGCCKGSGLLFIGSFFISIYMIST